MEPRPAPRRITGGGPGEGSRERLLDVAERLFAEKGFTGASVREITAAAGHNVAAVNYHFGGKENLYLEVFRRRLRVMRERRIASLHRALVEAGPRADIELVVRTFATSFLEPLLGESDGRTLLALISREMSDPRLPHQVFVEEMMLPVQNALRQALQQVEPGLTDERCHLAVHSLVAQLVHVVHSGRFAGHASFDPFDGIELAGIVDHIVRFSTAGIRALATQEDV